MSGPISGDLSSLFYLACRLAFILLSALPVPTTIQNGIARAITIRAVITDTVSAVVKNSISLPLLHSHQLAKRQGERVQQLRVQVHGRYHHAI